MITIVQCYYTVSMLVLKYTPSKLKLSLYYCVVCIILLQN